MSKDKLFDQVLGEENNDGFTEDGDLELDKIKLGSKKNEDSDEDSENDSDEENQNNEDDSDENSDEDSGSDSDEDSDENSNDEDDSDEDSNEEDSDDEDLKKSDNKKKNTPPEDDDGFGITDDDIKDETPSDDKFSYSSIANDLADVIPFDEKDEEITKEVFVSKVKSAIENASKTLDKTKYDPSIVRVIEHLDADPENITDFYQNKVIRMADDFLSKEKETQLRIVLTNELRSSVAKEDLVETVNNRIEEMTEKEQDAKLNTVKAQLNKAKKIEFEKITQASQDFKIQKEKEAEVQAKEERETLISQVDKMNNFLGLPVNDRTKKFIKNEIMNGNFDKVLDEDVANVKIDAYFYKKFGSKILANFESKMTEEAKKSFRKGTEKQKEVKHNIGKKGSSSSSKKGIAEKGFKGLKDMLPEDEF